jgi:hypothetical protein
MVYNFRLFWRMALRSWFGTQNTHGQLKRKRILFLILFYLLWPGYTVFTWACLLLDEVLFPAYRKQVVDKPLFILGNFRSGSTFLHRLLSRDSRVFTSLRTWDIFFAPSVLQRKIIHLFGHIDRALGSPVKRALSAVDQRSLGQVRIHRISLFEPEEDENILFHTWSSFFVGVLFPFLDEMPPYQFFDAELPDRDKKRLMAYYKACLQRHLYATGAQHFVAKNPSFSPKIESIVETFPDARIIYLARNPLDMLPSTVSWLAYAWHVFGVPLEEYPYRPEVVQLCQHWYRHPLAYLDAHPSPLYWVLKYDDLIGDPERIIRDLYVRFDYPRHPGLDRLVERAVQENQAFRSDHVYSYEEMGFSREQIVRDFADIFARFGFNPRGPAELPRVTQEEPATQPIPAAD